MGKNIIDQAINSFGISKGRQIIIGSDNLVINDGLIDEGHCVAIKAMMNINIFSSEAIFHGLIQLEYLIIQREAGKAIKFSSINGREDNLEL